MTLERCPKCFGQIMPDTGKCFACIPKCKCGFNPSLNPDKFETTYSEYGMLDKLLKTTVSAECKTCHDKFKHEIPNND